MQQLEKQKALISQGFYCSGGPLWTSMDCVLAEQVGFEPTVRHNRTPDFESGAFDHSATAPEFGSRGAKAVIVAEARAS
jgi:hypothetical protein